MALDISRKDGNTAFGSESLVYIAECDLSESTGTKSIASGAWHSFPCVIEESLAMEPKTGELLDDRGRVVHSYSQPSKVKYTGNIFQRDKQTFKFLRENANTTLLMWVVVGQIGMVNQEILMYGKLGGNYTESMSSDPKIPIEFTCLVNPVKITATAPPSSLGISYATSITIKASEMIAKEETAISSSQTEPEE